MSDYAKIMAEYEEGNGVKMSVQGSIENILTCLSFLAEAIVEEINLPLSDICNAMMIKEKAAQSASTDERQSLN